MANCIADRIVKTMQTKTRALAPKAEDGFPLVSEPRHKVHLPSRAGMGRQYGKKRWHWKG